MRPPDKHLRNRMAQRQISEAEIGEALDSPETQYPSEDYPDRTVILGRTSSGRRLKVVTLTDDPGHVITVADRDVDE